MTPGSMTQDPRIHDPGSQDPQDPGVPGQVWTWIWRVTGRLCRPVTAVEPGLSARTLDQTPRTIPVTARKRRYDVRQDVVTLRCRIPEEDWTRVLAVRPVMARYGPEGP